jgi:hypothetical protein
VATVQPAILLHLVAHLVELRTPPITTPPVGVVKPKVAPTQAVKPEIERLSVEPGGHWAETSEVKEAATAANESIWNLMTKECMKLDSE